MKKTSALLLLLMIAFSACNKATVEDPLRGQPENVRKGVPPKAEKLDNRTPIPRNSTIIESEPRYAEFIEGNEGKLTITGRLIDIEGSYSLSVENLPKGSSFNKDTGEFFWMPSRDDLIGNQSFRRFDLSVWMYVETAKGKTAIQKYIPIYLTRQGVGRPQIKSVLDLKSWDQLDTKKNHVFTVIVEDAESHDDADLSYPPEVQFTTPILDNYYFNGAGIIKMKKRPVQDPIDPARWTFEFEILMAQIAFEDSKTWKIAMVALNRYGARSSVRELTFTTKPKNATPRISWYSTQLPKVKVGQLINQTFSLYVPKKGGNGLTFKCLNHPAGSSCKCEFAVNGPRQAIDRNTLDCAIVWTPTVNQRNRTHKIKIEATYKRDSWTSNTKVFERAIRVDAAPRPATPVNNGNSNNGGGPS